MIDWLTIRNNLINILFILTLSIFMTIILSIPIYYILISKIYNFSVPDSDLMKEYINLINFLVNPFIHQLKFLYFDMSTNGLSHFIDVKRLFFINQLVLIISIFVKTKWKISLKFYKNDYVIISLVPIAIGIIALVDFNQFFIFLHMLLFQNHNWLFDPNIDPIINVLPESFFEILIFLFFVIFQILSFVGYKKKI